MDQCLRVAFFPDTYDEIDGVANTSRQFEAFARRRGLPFLMVCGGAGNQVERDGPVERIIRFRGPIGFRLDQKHDFDLLFWRHYRIIEDAVRQFAPDILHITGPSDVGQLGALVASRLRIPLAASWHTNLHEYAEQRASWFIRLLPSRMRVAAGRKIRDASLLALLRFYKIAQLLFAPNPELMELLGVSTGQMVYPMQRGVDVSLFNPARRDRTGSDFVVGYVGRLTVEKNIHYLAAIEQALVESGFTNFRISIVGQGAEEPWLKENLRRAHFAGVLTDEALARAYANMDAFVFPSRTDTFGNVVLEALACGVPSIVTDSGGPQFIVKHGETGFVAHSTGEFITAVRELAANPEKLAAMRTAARAAACRSSWDAIFEGLYAAYEQRLRTGASAWKNLPVRPRPTVVTL